MLRSLLSGEFLVIGVGFEAYFLWRNDQQNKWTTEIGGTPSGIRVRVFEVIWSNIKYLSDILCSVPFEGD